MTRARILWAVRLLAVTGALLDGCGSATHVDMYFGTDAGADFQAPEREAGLGTPDAGDGGVD